MNERDSSPHVPLGRPARPGRRSGRVQPIALEPQRAQESLRDDGPRLAALVAAQQAIAGADLDLHALVHLIVERVQQLTGAAGAAIALAEGEGLVCGAASGTARNATHAEEKVESGWLPENVPVGKMWRCDEPWLVPVDEDNPARPGASCSRLVLPLHHRGRLVGVLEILAPQAHAFDDREVHTLQLLEGLLAAVLSHARDFEAHRILLERRAAELHESAARFEGAFTFSAFGMACVAPGGRFVQVNPALCALLGYPEEELLRLDLAGLTHSDDRALHQVYLDRLLLGELRNYQLEQRYLARDGRTVWALLSVSLVRDRQGGPRYLIAQFQDQTAHRRLQERFEELQRLESLARLIAGLPAELRLDTGSAGKRPRRGRRRRESAGVGAPREWAFDGWYCKRGDVIVGPFSRDDLRQLVESGQVRGAERVWERWKLGVESFLVPTTARAACVS